MMQWPLYMGRNLGMVSGCLDPLAADASYGVYVMGKGKLMARCHREICGGHGFAKKHEPDFDAHRYLKPPCLRVMGVTFFS